MPGWAKVDGCDGSDLFRQNRTVARSAGSSTAATASSRTFPRPGPADAAVDVLTRNVTLQILATNARTGST